MVRLESLLFATPLLALWLISPLIARWLSQPFHRSEPKLDPVQIRFLHRMARETWGFFETFITAENHWLPPDNYQEAPVEALARRTSPTNMGLSLLANLTAYDFGYISMQQFLDTTPQIHYRQCLISNDIAVIYITGIALKHWQPLLPRYISTVDSGNLGRSSLNASTRFA